MLKLTSCLVLLLLVLVTSAAAEAPPAGKRVALVIGNSAYHHVERLKNSDNDARLMAKTLLDVGFTLIGGGALLDLDRAGMAKAVEDFGRALPGADVTLFYYSGHGLQVQGVNWLVPVDANPTRPQDLDFQMLSADLVLRQMDGAGAKLNLVLLDACRNNPFSTSALRAVESGLAEMRAPEGTLISYATQPGNVAWDGGGSNSPYTQALTDNMRHPGLDIFHLFNAVGLQVKRITDGAQQPWVSTSPIDGDFFFMSVAPNQQVALASPATAPVPKALPETTVPPAQTAPVARNLVPPPCALLEEHNAGDHVELRGLAASGTAWDAFATQVQKTQGTRGASVIKLMVDLYPDFACAPIDALAASIRAAKASGGLFELSPHAPLQGEPLTVTMHATNQQAVVRLDLFLPRGAVRHLVSRPLQGGDIRLREPDTDAPGPRVLVAIITSSPLDLGERPASEQAASYLDALRRVLPADARADIGFFTLRARPVQPAATRAPPSAQGGRCASILERAQLGDTLTEGERQYLRAECH